MTNEAKRNEDTVEPLVRLTVRNLKTGSEWTEDYKADDLPDLNHMARRRRDKRVAVETQEEAEAWGKGLIAWFNSTAAPGEARRELAKAEYLPNNPICVKPDSGEAIEQPAITRET